MRPSPAALLVPAIAAAIWTLPVAAGPVTLPAASQPAADSPAGLWPTPKMLDALLRRWAAQAAQEYELSPEQHRKLEEQLLERWPPFLEAHRDEIQPLVNEYFEARFAMTAPSKEAVQAWAARGLPAFEALREQVGEANNRFASILSARQRLKFEVQRAQYAMVFEVFGGRLRAWEKGEFTESEWWDPPAGLGRRDRTADTSAATQPADPLLEELSAWDEFVEAFCKQYDLDRGQREAAASILRELKDRAGDHRDRHRSKMDALERTITAPDPDVDPAAVEKELQALYGPIDAMFRELETRLRMIPTQSQRRRAGQPATSGPAHKVELESP